MKKINIHLIRILTILFILLVGSYSFAQKNGDKIHRQAIGNIIGIISRLSDGTPVQGAIVTISDNTGTYRDTTAIDGEYVIDSAEVGDYALTVSKEGYITINDSIAISESQTLTKNYQLTALGLLFDNGPFVTNPGVGPGGSDISLMESPDISYGTGCKYTTSSYVADDFIVTDFWTVDSLAFYGFQPNSSTSPTITGLYVQIWNGDPSLATSSVVWGDMIINILTSTRWTGCYRAANLNATNRPIMKIVTATPGLALSAGNYWVEWSYTGSLSNGPWANPVAILGQYNTGNAKWYFSSASVWYDYVDDGSGGTKGLPFQIYGATENSPTNDMSMLFLLEPVTDTNLTANEAVKIRIKNSGTEVQSNIPVSYTINGSNTVNEVIPGPINSGDVLDYTFNQTADLSAVQTYDIVATVNISGDEYPENNSKSKSVTNQGNLVLMHNGTISVCNGTFCDSGGLNGKYMNNENYTLTLMPSTTGAKMKCSFTQFNVENNYDYLKVYDGTDASATLIGSFTGVTIPVALVNLEASAGNTSGALTFNFISDNGTNAAGWAATISCVTPLTVGNIGGTITKLSNGIPAENAIVTISNNLHAYSDTTDANGMYLINSVEIGNYALTVSKEGYIVINDSIAISENQTLTKNYQLTALGLLFDNGPFVTNLGAGYGGADVSLVESPNTLWGQWCSLTGETYVAEDLSVTDAWTIDSLIFYGYQTRPAIPSPTSTFTGLYVQIWNGDPDLSTSSVIWGDMTTNILATTRWTGCYRASADNITTALDPIMNIVAATPNLTLFSGDYWIEWACTGSLNPNPTANLITILGQINTGNAKKWNFQNSTWDNIVDDGSGGTKGLPFQVYGNAGNLPTNDIAIMSILTPVTAPNLTTNEVVSIKIKNNGTASQSNIPVSYTINGNTTVNEIIPGPINNGNELNYTFTHTADLSTVQTYDVVASVNLPGDEYPMNNSKSKSVTNQGDIILMQNGTFSKCGGTFYDSGGPDGGYQSGENYTLTLIPSTPGAKMKCNFMQFDLWPWDYLNIYDGPDGSATLIGSFTGNTVPAALVDLEASASNTSGALTFNFASEKKKASSYGLGWTAGISCVSPLAHDLAATSISGDVAPTVGMSSDYTITVINTGAETELGSNYTVSLYDSSNILIGSANGTDIAVNQTALFVIPWMPSDSGNTYVYGKVMLTGDQNPANDQTSNYNVTVGIIKNLPLIENWTSRSFATNNWTFDPIQGNWDMVFLHPSYPTAPLADFLSIPLATNYSHALVSPMLDATAISDNIILKYAIYFDNYSTSTVEGMAVEVFDGTTWQIVQDYTNISGSFDLPSESYDITQYAAGHNFKVRFRAYGANSGNIIAWYVDDIKIYQQIIGNLTGTVTKLSDGSPVAGATVSITNALNGSYNVTTAANGAYSINNIYTINGLSNYALTVSKESYNIINDSITFTGNQTLTKNYQLTAPEISVYPDFVNVTVPAGQTITRSVTLHNNGNGLLMWNESLQPGKQQISTPVSNGIFEHSLDLTDIASGTNETNVTGTQNAHKNMRGSTAYGFDYTNKVLMSINTDDPSHPTTIANVDAVPVGGTFDAYNTSFMYIIDDNDGNIKKVDITTGNITVIGSAGLDGFPTGLSCDKSTGILYASSTTGTESSIYKIDPITGSGTFIGTTGIPDLIDIAIDGTGQMYGYDVSAGGTNTDNAYKIDKTSGASTLLGSIGFNAKFAQGMCWDPVSDNIYLAASNYTTLSAELRVLDKTTGNTVLIGTFPCFIDGFAFSGGGIGNWASTNPSSGTIAPGDSAAVAITFDGNYASPQKGLTVTSNLEFISSPDVGTTNVALSMTIPEELNGNLNGTVKHGTIPVEGVTVTATREESPTYTYSMITNTDGVYNFDSTMYGTYDFTAVKEGYNFYSVTGIVVTGGHTTTYDIAMLAPIMTVDPLAIIDSSAAGNTITRTLTINNIGDGVLTWNASSHANTSQKISIPVSDGNFEHTFASLGIGPSVNKIDTTNTQNAYKSIKGSTAYGFDLHNGIFMSINTDDPSNPTTIANVNVLPVGGTFDIANTDSMYIIDYNDNNIKKIDVATGNVTTIGPAGLWIGDKPTGLTCDKTTGIIYASSATAGGGESRIYTINPETGASTLIGTTGIPFLIDIAIDGTGQMYGYDIIGDNAYKINKTIGTSTLLGSIGFDANYSQGMCWDPVTDSIYLAAFNVTYPLSYELRVLDRTTGNTSVVGSLPCEIDGFAFPGGGNTWLSIDSKTGTIEPGTSQQITVTLDGNYQPPTKDGTTLQGNIDITSDPNVGSIIVPVTFTIEKEFYGQITGTITHNGEGIGGAVIKAHKEWVDYTATSNADGSYIFPQILAGTYNITVVATGYNPNNITGIMVVAGDTTTQNIVMTAPVMIINPSAIEDSTTAGNIITRTITINNTGDGVLVWNAYASANKEISIPVSDGNFEHSPASAGIAPIANKMNITNAYKGIKGSTAYGFDLGNSIFMSINTDDPSNPTTIATVNATPFGGTFDAFHTDFMYILDNNGDIKKVDIATGGIASIGSAGLQTNDTPTGLSCDKTTGTLYASSTSGDESSIYTIDPATGASTFIGTTGIPALIDITFDGTGQMYGYDIVNDNSYKIDKTSGTSTLIGSIGFNANYAQGMSWDPVSNNIYLAAFNYSTSAGELRVLDKTTGNTAIIGSLPNEIDGFAFPGGGNTWLSINPNSDTIQPGTSQEIAVTLDALNYQPPTKGTILHGDIDITSDPNVGSVTVPVTFTIQGDFYGQITGTITHNGVGIGGANLTIQKESSNNNYTAISNADGSYVFPQVLVGTYDMTATAIGYNSITTTGILVTGGQTATQNIVMTAPTMDVNPATLTVSLPVGETTDRTIVITNNGDGILGWTGIVQSNNEQQISIPACNGNFEHGTTFLGIAPVVNKTNVTSAYKGTKGSIAYGFDVNNKIFMSFDMDDPSNPTTIANVTVVPFGGTFDVSNADFMYIIDYNDGNIKKVDVATGNVTTVGPAGLQSGDTPTGLTCDKSTGTFYAASTSGSESMLYTINPVTGASTIIGATGIPALIDIAIDGEGQMYGYDIVGDNAYMIDKTSGTSTLIGSIGFDASYAQGMCWDPASNAIYMAAYNASTSAGELRILDKETGNTTIIGSLQGEIDGFAFPGGGSSWLNLDPKIGTLAAGTNQNVTVHFDATDLSVETYTASITFHSAPYIGNITIPITFNVTSNVPIVSVTPANQDVTSAAGTTTFAVANIGIGTMNYTAAVTTGNDWLTITSGGSGVNTGTINVSYTDNTSTSPRTGTITVTAPGATGSPVQVTVTQAAASVPAAIVTITDTTTLVSGPFVVPVRAQNITNMGSFQFTIEYDPSIILFDSITNWHAGIDAVTTGNPSAGHITFVWAADLNGINIADGNFFDINFDWIASDVIQTHVNWSDNPTPREFADYNGNIFVPVYNNGTETGPDGIPEIGSSSIKVFPNPATDVVNITVSNDISTVQVMNYLGMITYSENITQEKTITLKTSNYSAGNYFVRFVTNNGQTLIKKMVIIK